MIICHSLAGELRGFSYIIALFSILNHCYRRPDKVSYETVTQ